MINNYKDLNENYYENLNKLDFDISSEVNIIINDKDNNQQSFQISAIAQNCIKGSTGQESIIRQESISNSDIEDDIIDDNPYLGKDQDNLNSFFPDDEMYPLKGEDSGKFLSYEYKDDNNVVFGTDSAERIDAVQDLKTSLDQSINMIKHKLKHEDSFLSNEQKQKLNDKLKLYEDSYARAKENNSSFINSNFYRDEMGKVVSNKNLDQKSYDEEIDKISLGAAVNYRYQKCDVQGKEIGGFFRLGVITDPRNGFTNLEELNDPKLLEKKIETLEEKRTKLLKKPKKNQAEIRAINYALEQLKPENLGNTRKEREFILENQMLQLVIGQVGKNLEKIKGDEKQATLPMVHIALLNQKNNKFDRKAAWAHSEENQMKDMQSIFKAFEGRTIIFDGKGPCIGPNGEIHFPEEIKDDSGNPRKIALEPTFMNISVQGHTKNDGAQAICNTEGMKSLIDIASRKSKVFPQDKQIEEGKNLLLEIKKGLEKGESNYQIAEDLGMALLKLGIPLSIGCLSAKDRTGFVGGRLVLRLLLEKIEQHKDFKKLKRKFELSILKKNGVAALVTKDNTGTRILKCSSFQLPGIGTLKRINYYAKQLRTIPIFSKKDTEVVNIKIEKKDTEPVNIKIEKNDNPQLKDKSRLKNFFWNKTEKNDTEPVNIKIEKNDNPQLKDKSRLKNIFNQSAKESSFWARRQSNSIENLEDNPELNY